MSSVTEPECEQALSRVVGLPLRTIGRACNLLWLHFGQWREVPDRGGRTKTVGEWALHVQGEWTLSKLWQPVTSSADYYVSPDGQDLGNDWDRPGSSQFDAAAAALSAAWDSSPPIVASVNCAPNGAFFVTFNDGMILSVAHIETEGDESWRLFNPGTDNPHFVVS